MSRIQHNSQQARRLSRAAELLVHRTTELAYVAGLGLAVSAGTVAAQPGSDTKNEKGDAMTQQQPTERPLETQLAEMKEQFMARAPQETIDRYNQGVEDVAAMGIVGTAKDVGEQAPMFELPDATGQTVALQNLLADGPVIVTFYRGGWCPYCNLQLRSYQQNLEQFAAYGASVVAISPELPDESLSTKDKNELEFVVLSDAGNRVADEFGIRYRLPDDLIDAFSGKLDLDARNGDGSWTLPLAATYIINTDGVISYAYLSADYRERAEPADILEALKGLEPEG